MSDDGTPRLIAPRAAHRIDAVRLDVYLAAHVSGFGAGLKVDQFEGGQSNPTYLLSAPTRRWVLRKKPPGDLLPTAHMVEREYRILDALGASELPVPAVVHLCEDPDVIGTAFYVMEHVEGRVFHDITLPGCAPAAREAIYRSMVAGLATLHAVDVEAVGLADLGRPSGYLERQVARWSRQYQATATEDVPEMDALMNWLPGHLPVDGRTTLAHGDYRLGNLVFAPTEPVLRAVLDWELATLGDPIADLAYLCMSYHYGGPGRPCLREHAGGNGGIPTEQAVLDAYCEFTGLDGVPHWPFYLAFSFFRLASILQGVYRRGLDGNAASEAALGKRDLVRVCAATGWRAVS